LQETEWIERDGGKTLAAYSIGNMISGMLGADNMLGGFLCFDIVKKDSGETAIENVRMIPAVTHYRYETGRTGPYLPVYSFENGRTGFQVYRFEDYTKELAAEHGVSMFDPEFSYDYIKNLIIQRIPPEFLGDFYKN
jgi:poly-gamma-glutamate synthesis protein (capsule biosynthesis protein)